MKEADLNKDNVISFEEFKRVMADLHLPFLYLMSLLLTLITLLPSLFLSHYIFSYPCSFLSLHPNSLQVLDNPDIANKLSIQFSI